MQQKLYASSYFHSLLHFDTVEPIIDELLNVCKDIKPHVPGTDVPSTLFCCLYRLFQLRLRKHQLDSILNFMGPSNNNNNKDAFVRVVGILYVRFGLHPDQYLSHYKHLLLDIQRIPQCKPTSSASMTVKEGRESHPPASTASALFRAEASGTVNREAAKMEPLSSLATCYIDDTCLTIGEFIENILIDERYHGIVLPRIPISTKKEIVSTIESICKPEFRRLAETNTEKIEYFTEGAKVDACSNHDWLHGEIIEVNSSLPHRVTVTVQLEDDTTEELSIGMLRLLNSQRDKESKRSRGSFNMPSPYEENARSLYPGSKSSGKGRSPPDEKYKKKRYYHM